MNINPGELRQRVEEWRKQQIDVIESEYLARIKAIEKVVELAGASAEDARTENPPEIKRLRIIHHHNWPGPTKAVRMAIATFDGEFSYHNIRQFIEDRLPQAHVDGPAISSALNKLTKQGEIEQLRPGAGRSPAVYRRTTLFQASDRKDAELMAEAEA